MQKERKIKSDRGKKLFQITFCYIYKLDKREKKRRIEFKNQNKDFSKQE